MATIGSLIIELGLDDKKTKSELRSINAELTSFQNKVNDLDLGKLSAMSTQLDKKLLSVQSSITTTTNKIAKLQSEMSSIKGSRNEQLVNANTSSIDILKQKLASLQNEEDMLIAKTTIVGKKIESLGNNPGPDSLKQDFQELGNKIDGSGEKITKSFSKGLKGLKTFSVALMGTREIWSLLTQSANTYIQSNEALSAKLEGTKQALGQALAPVIELAIAGFSKLVSVIILAINYLFTFINVIFGTNLAITKTVKQLNKVGSSAKKANKEMSALAGFDELNVLNSDSGSADAGGIVPDFTGIGPTADQLAGLQKFQEWLANNQEPIKIITLLIAGLAGAFIILNSPLLFTLGLFALLGYLIYEIVSGWDEMSNAQRVLSILRVVLIGIIALVWLFNASLLANPMTWIVLAVIAVIGLLIASFFLIKDNWDAIVSWFVNTFKAIGGFFSDLGKSIGDFFKGIWDGITNGIKYAVNLVKGFIEGIKTVFSAVWKFILGLLSAGGQIFTGIVDGIANIMKGVINALLKGINFIIAKPLEFINGVLNFIRNIEFLGISPFKGLWKQNPIPIPQIPMLASGSSLTQETLFIGGEYPGARSNPEIVSPKSDIVEANKQAIEEMGGAGGGRPIQATVIVEIGGKEAGRKLIELINDTQEDAGKTLLKI